jgi:hypothetical protein
MVAEVDDQPDNAHRQGRLGARGGAARVRLFRQLAEQCEVRLKPVSVAYRMPDLTGCCNPDNERPMALLYALAPWRNDGLMPESSHLVRSAYFGMYASCFTHDANMDQNWKVYLKDLANRVLNPNSSSG